jgi:ribonuclease HI
MTNKKQAKQSMMFLRNLLGDNEEAQDALDVVADHLQEIDFDSLDGTSEVQYSGGQFPLPHEITSLNDAFALFSDGACRGNPGPGSWGSMGQNINGEVIFEASGVDTVTTNNKMELEGAIQALERLKSHQQAGGLSAKTPVILYSDSKYVVDGIMKWVPGWKRRGWKKADKKTPENVEQWQELDRLKLEFGEALSFRWVKGHAGHPQNERCDQLANLALDEAGF